MIFANHHFLPKRIDNFVDSISLQERIILELMLMFTQKKILLKPIFEMTVSRKAIDRPVLQNYIVNR